jgi:hypothetical protein
MIRNRFEYRPNSIFPNPVIVAKYPQPLGIAELHAAQNIGVGPNICVVPDYSGPTDIQFS